MTGIVKARKRRKNAFPSLIWLMALNCLSCDSYVHYLFLIVLTEDKKQDSSIHGRYIGERFPSRGKKNGPNSKLHVLFYFYQNITVTESGWLLRDKKCKNK